MQSILDRRIEEASEPLVDLEHCAVRLQSDARFPWLILIPRRTGLTELSDLLVTERCAVLEETVWVGEGLRRAAEAQGRPVEKLNIAAIGNLVPQLHIHVVGRRRDDGLWPDPVWGRGPSLPYAPEALALWRTSLRQALR